jgi:hypothetical protein
MMRRDELMRLVAAVAVGVVVYLVASGTYWADVTVPLPPKGEALTNAFYAAERLVEALGARAAHDRLFTPPPSGAVVVLSRWNWNLSSSRREALERWVESGGRLVVDQSVSGGPEFTRWSSIRHQDREGDEVTSKSPGDGRCVRFQEEGVAHIVGSDATRWLCDFDETKVLATNRQVQWALTDSTFGRQVVRVAIGRGSVTMINAQPFQYRALFDGDHGWLLATAAGLERGDDVRFLSEGDHPSLLSLVWQYGAPVVWVGLTALGLLLWRGGIRFGPLAPQNELLRRSLGEQIRGTGRFVLKHDHGEPLHAATVRALDDAARRRVAGYGRLAPQERVAALAEAGGTPAERLAEALYYPGTRRPIELHGAIARLETTRRAILRRSTRTLHGTE